MRCAPEFCSLVYSNLRLPHTAKILLPIFVYSTHRTFFDNNTNMNLLHLGYISPSCRFSLSMYYTPGIHSPAPLVSKISREPSSLRTSDAYIQIYLIDYTTFANGTPSSVPLLRNWRHFNWPPMLQSSAIIIFISLYSLLFFTGIFYNFLKQESRAFSFHDCFLSLFGSSRFSFCWNRYFSIKYNQFSVLVMGFCGANREALFSNDPGDI